MTSTSTPRFCKDCNHSKERKLSDRHCAAPDALVMNLVEGPQTRRCEQARRIDGPCGPAGVLFVERVGHKTDLVGQPV